MTKAILLGLVSTLVAVVAYFAPVQNATSVIRLNQIKTDASVNFKPVQESDAKICPGAWFKEMVLPAGDEQRQADYLRNTVS